ncbi:hypothetical protein GCM10027039_19500 [Terrabacter koreensis]
MTATVDDAVHRELVHREHGVTGPFGQMLLGDRADGLTHETQVLRAELDTAEPALAGDRRPAHVAIVPLMGHLWDVKAPVVSG